MKEDTKMVLFAMLILMGVCYSVVMIWWFILTDYEKMPIDFTQALIYGTFLFGIALVFSICYAFTTYIIEKRKKKPLT